MDRVKPDPNDSHNDVVMSGADADDTPDPLCLEPTDPTVDAARHRQRESESCSTNLDAPEPPPTRIQFSLRHLMLTTLVIAIGLATLQLVLPIFVVFLLGVVAFAFLVAVSVWQPTKPTLYVMMWSFLFLYIMTSLVLLIGF